MAQRTALRPYRVINAASMAASITSSVTILNSLSEFSYEAIWSAGATPVGTLSIEVSNDYQADPSGAALVAGTWAPLVGAIDFASVSSSIPVSGNSGTVFANIKIRAYAVRCVYTRASGSGTLNVTFVGGVA